jgi:hypothetical protein
MNKSVCRFTIDVPDVCGLKQSQRRKKAQGKGAPGRVRARESRVRLLKPVGRRLGEICLAASAACGFKARAGARLLVNVDQFNVVDSLVVWALNSFQPRPRIAARGCNRGGEFEISPRAP